MQVTSFFKKLFGGAGRKDASVAANKVADEVYKDVSIFAQPISDGGQWRVAGTITKQIDGNEIIRKFIRADLLQSEPEAVIASVSKAKLIIDQMGSALWTGDLNHPV